MSVSVCLSLSVCVCLPRSYLRNDTSDLHQFFCESYYVVMRYVLPDDAMFAHKPRLLDVAAQLKRSAHAALGLAINCAQ